MIKGPITERYTGALPAAVYSSIPGQPDFGGGMTIDDVGGYSPNQIGDSYILPPISFGNRQNVNGPIVGIGIAADSPMSEVDLWLGDVSLRNRIRIGVGRPWFGDTSQIDDCNLTFPRGIPRPFDFTGASPEAIGETQAQWQAQNAVWDTTYAASLGSAFFPAGIEQAFPVRLELYRGVGEFPVPVRRSPIVADLLYRLKASAYARFWIITDGRAVIDVNVLAQRGGASYPAPSNAATVIVRTHDPVLSIASVDTASRADRLHVSTTLDTQILPSMVVLPSSQWPSYKQSFVVPAAMYSVTVVNSSPGAAAGNGIAGSISIVARDA